MSTLRKSRVKGMRRESKRKSPGGGGPTVIDSTGTGGFAPRMLVKLKYAQYTPLSPSASVVSQIYRANSVFDPDFTGTGGQPYNFDDFAIEYKRYRVRACSIDVTFQSGLASTSRGCTVVVVPTNSSTAFSSIFDAMSAPNARWSTLISQGNASQWRCRMRMTTKQVLGEDWGDRFEALVSADPSDPWYFQLLGFSNDATTNAALNIVACLTYEVEFFDRNILTLDAMRHYVADKDAKLMRPLESKEEHKDGCPEGYELVAVPLRRAPGAPMIQVDGPGIQATPKKAASSK